VHAHPPVSSALASAGIPLDTPLLIESVLTLGVIPVAPYAPPGSEELARGAAGYARDYNGVLLEHHGAVAWADSVMRAYMRLESIEHSATVWMYAKMMGVTRPMTDVQIRQIIDNR